MSNTRKPNTETDVKIFLLTLSNYQEQLLQNYRNLFTVSQTFLISIALLILVQPQEKCISIFVYIALSCFGFIFIGFWWEITENRELDVTYCHMQLRKLEEKKLTVNEKYSPWICFKDWQTKFNEGYACPKNEKKRVLNNYDPTLLTSATRMKMGLFPWIFFCLWSVGYIVLIIRWLN